MGHFKDGPTTRRQALLAGAAMAGGAALTLGMPNLARAEDKPAIGTYPAGSSGDSVFVGITVPRTGTYAVQGEDCLKGYQLAIEHLNEGNPLIKAMSPKTTKGILGKTVKFGVADEEAKPNTAVQAASRFISENKAVMITGSVSSATAVALNKLADREKVIYLPGISGSNDTTGKDCARYSFRTCFYGQTAAAALAPVLIQNLGKNKKIAFLTPDYTYGHTVRQAMEEYLKKGGWTVSTNQVCPLGTPDYSSYLLNIANSAFCRSRRWWWPTPCRSSPKRWGRTSWPAFTRPRISGGRSRTSSRSPSNSSTRSWRSSTTSPNGAPIAPICRSRCGPTRWSGPGRSTRRM
jgi:ABC-type branched-subunit amino acid transport system substrate-binding protein